ncbi:MAG TPA: hypothetical protein VHC50_02880 [Puia sp.]|nr:hypothetical protein [Puia sp.]
MFKLVCFLFGLIASVLTAILQGVPTFWPKKRDHKPPKWIGISWAIALSFWFVFGSISVFDFYNLGQTNDSLTKENGGYVKEISFDKTFISFLPKKCIEEAGKKYSEAQTKLKEVDAIHEKVGSPEALVSGLGLSGALK